MQDESQSSSLVSGFTRTRVRHRFQAKPMKKRLIDALVMLTGQ